MGLDDNRMVSIDSRENYLEECSRWCLKGVAPRAWQWSNFKSEELHCLVSSWNVGVFLRIIYIYPTSLRKGKKWEWPWLLVSMSRWSVALLWWSVDAKSRSVLKKIRREIRTTSPGRSWRRFWRARTFSEVYSGIEGDKAKNSLRDYRQIRVYQNFLTLKALILSKPIERSGHLIQVNLITVSTGSVYSSAWNLYQDFLE